VRMRAALLLWVAFWSSILAVFSEPVSGGALTLSLYASSGNGWGFTSTNMTIPGPVIVVFAGERLSLTLFSVDGEAHNFGVDYDGDGQSGPGEPISGSFAGTAEYEFNATSIPGSYAYRCLLHPGTMFGRFDVIQKSPTSVGLAPQEIETRRGQVFRVAVNASSVQDLYAYRVRLGFDPGRLEAIEVSVGGTIMEVNERPFAASLLHVNNTLGEIGVDVLIQGTLPGVTGSGPLVFVDFVSLVSGMTVIDVDDLDTVLLDGQLEPIPHSTVDGSVSVLEAALVDAWTTPGVLRLSGSKPLVVEAVVLNSGPIPIYAMVSFNTTASKSSGSNLTIINPVYLGPEEKRVISLQFLPALVTDRYGVEVTLVLSAQLLLPGDSAWLGGNRVYVSFRTIADG